MNLEPPKASVLEWNGKRFRTVFNLTYGYSWAFLQRNGVDTPNYVLIPYNGHYAWVSCSWNLSLTYYSETHGGDS